MLRACLRVGNARKQEKLLMRMPGEGALQTPLNFLSGACVTFLI